MIKRSELDTIQKREKLNTVYRTGDIGPGGAYHDYEIQRITEGDGAQGFMASMIRFQKGARNEPRSRPGILDSDLLEIVRDRLKHFQDGDYSSWENANALAHVEEALEWMNRRVEDRIERDVLGTYSK